MNAVTNAVQLSEEQQRAVKFVIANLHAGVLAIAGPAGSGKSTLVKQLCKELESYGRVMVSAMTNKACYVLQRKGIPAESFHSVCMRPLFRPPMDKLGNFLEQSAITEEDKVKYPEELEKQFTKAVLRAALDTVRKSGIYAAMRGLGIKDIFQYIEGWYPAGPQEGVLIIDEASMLGGKELKNAQEVFSKIILVGDEHQLAPVKSEAVFWTIETRFALKEIHRQAGSSQPLKIATAIREGWKLEMGDIEDVKASDCAAGTPVIVWMNKTRESLTFAIRRALGYSGKGPQVGENLICRASDRDSKMRGLINNSLWKVVEANGYVCTLENEMGTVLRDERIFIEELEKGDGAPFRFGYVMTAYNAQGSEFDSVMIHNEDTLAFARKDKALARKFLYTAVTRAKTKVTKVSSKVV